MNLILGTVLLISLVFMPTDTYPMKKSWHGIPENRICQEQEKEELPGQSKHNNDQQEHWVKIKASDLLSLVPKAKNISKLRIIHATNETLSNLNKFPKLTELDLTGCTEINDQGMEILANNCEKLTVLGLWGTEISGQGARTIAKKYPNLNILDLRKCIQITDADVKYITRHCRNLTKLDLRKCPLITDVAVKSIATRCPEITVLSLEHTQVSDKGIEEIVNKCPKLTTISLSWCPNITIKSFQLIAGTCPNLRALYISHIKLNQIHVRFLAINCKQLRVLKCPIEDTKLVLSKISDKWLRAIIKNCPNITYLNLDGCTQLTDRGIREVVRKCPNLTYLSLVGCTNMTDDGIQAIAEYCPQLTHLILNGCTEVTDRAIKKVASHCPNLTELDVTCCTKITDDSIKRIANNCRNLTYLGLMSCVQITDTSLIEIANNCKKLNMLGLQKCIRITDAGIKKIANNCPNITHLNLSECKNIRDISCLKALPKLQMLWVGHDINIEGIEAIANYLNSLYH